MVSQENIQLTVWVWINGHPLGGYSIAYHGVDGWGKHLGLWKYIMLRRFTA
jgi:hypothetical protein